MASLATVIAGAGIFGAGTALFMTVAYHPATDPAVARAIWDAGWLAYNSAGRHSPGRSVAGQVMPPYHAAGVLSSRCWA